MQPLILHNLVVCSHGYPSLSSRRQINLMKKMDGSKKINQRSMSVLTVVVKSCDSMAPTSGGLLRLRLSHSRGEMDRPGGHNTSLVSCRVSLHLHGLPI